MTTHHYYQPPIPIEQISKKSPYYAILKKADFDEKAKWTELKVILGMYFYLMQTILIYLKIKKRLKDTLNDFPKMSNKN